MTERKALGGSIEHRIGDRLILMINVARHLPAAAIQAVKSQLRRSQQMSLKTMPWMP
jgi:class 3 adenylate cyclase